MMLVLGGNGQVGRELRALADARGVRGVFRTRADVDVTDARMVAQAVGEVRPTVVINLAAYNQVDRAEGDRDTARRVNALGPGIVADRAAAAGVPVIHVSTDYVFDGEKGRAYVEGDPVGPLGVYGQTKEAGEQAVRAANGEHLILRTAWVYGVHATNVMKNILRLAETGNELSFVSDQVGSPTASRDLAEAILVAAAAAAGGDAPWGTYHVAGDGAASRVELAEAVLAARQRATGRGFVLHAVPASAFPTPARRPRHSALDSGLFASVFGYRCRPWKDAVSATVAEFFRRGEAP